MISINNFSKCFERDNLFEKVNLVIHSNKRIALVGNNGSGKTTFLKCLIGQEDFQGRIIADGVKFSIMEQENDFENLNKTFLDYIKEKGEELEAKKLRLETDMGKPEIYGNEDKFNSLMDRYNLLLANGEDDFNEDKLIEILHELGVNKNILRQKIIELSGGQKIKLRLAECLAKKADFYLLDEPTNHLDLDACEWLEKYILKYINSLIIVSHDRYFLNKITDNVLKVEEKSFEEYVGGYDEYEKKEILHLALLKKKFHNNRIRKTDLMKAVEKQRHWAMLTGNKTARARADRIEREAEAIDIGIDPDKLNLNIKMNFVNEKLHNCEIFRFLDFGKKFEDRILFENFNQEIEQGEKIAIIGGNGSGKTTFLKMLMGWEHSSSGSIYRRPHLKIGYFDQELSDVDLEMNVLDFLEERIGKKKELLIAGLHKFGFEDNFLEQKIGKLSGGEKGRLNILRITLEENEILLLDEPTNNLDICLKDSLEQAVREFKGTVIVVSHDRNFMDRVAERILEIKDKEIYSYKGNYSDYLQFRNRNI